MSGVQEKQEVDLNGHPVPILVQNEETGIFELQEEALEEILLNPLIAEKHVCVVAVAGASRNGKSFLLDFILRYINDRDKEDWLGDPDIPLTGFKWRQGCKRETTGILLWSAPFVMKRKSGEEVAVLLMDTQGTFDTQSLMKESTIVFALTTMVSSVLVYNLVNNVQENDLMNLQLFTSYGMLAQEDTDSERPFQKLQFLVRDWGFPYELEYGHIGGQELLKELLMVTKEQRPGHQEVRRDLRKCFKDIHCYLMPHPGFNVIYKADFDGRLSDIDEIFVKHLQVLVPRLLSPENLVKKEIGGQEVKCKDLIQFFKQYLEVLKNNDLPEPITLAEFAARASSQSALESGKDTYSEAMEALVVEDKPFLKTAQMNIEHNKAKEEKIDKMHNKCAQQNESKNLLKAAKTPATIFCILVVLSLALRRVWKGRSLH